MKEIIFTDTIGVPQEYKPKPATTYVPDWYKNLDSYIGKEKKPDGNGGNLATIKRCMPVFDAIVSGYILVTYVDVFVSRKTVEYVHEKRDKITGEEVPLTKQQIKKRKLSETSPHFEWPSFSPIQFHSIDQLPNYPNTYGNPVAIPKWINPWSIKTPPGYSVMFQPPLHRESAFSILPAIVDTDKYTVPVNFPFMLNNIDFEGVIPAGTPMAQVIPFKRESWKMNFGSQEDFVASMNSIQLLRTKMFDSYKSMFRQEKNYR